MTSYLSIFVVADPRRKDGALSILLSWIDEAALKLVSWCDGAGRRLHEECCSEHLSDWSKKTILR